MKLPVIFLCGDRSRYGLAHLESVAECFDMRAVIVADATRWQQFRERLSPPVPRVEPGWRRLRRWVKTLALAPRRASEERAHQARLRGAGAPVIVVHDANTDFLRDRVRGLGAELVLSAAYPQIFRKPFLDLAPRGAVNFHPSLLPRCRGAHPVYWCIASGEERSGVTAHFMTERIDDGDIIAQRAFPLAGLDYAGVYERVERETPPLVAEVAAFFAAPGAKAVPQDPALATTFRNDRDIHHCIAWSKMDAREIINRIRAGGAFAAFRGCRTILAQASLAAQNRHMTNGVSVEPGTVVDIDGRGLWVAARDGRYVVVEALHGGRRVENFRDWAAKRRVWVGDRFE